MIPPVRRHPPGRRDRDGGGEPVDGGVPGPALEVLQGHPDDHGRTLQRGVAVRAAEQVFADLHQRIGAHHRHAAPRRIHIARGVRVALRAELGAHDRVDRDHDRRAVLRVERAGQVQHPGPVLLHPQEPLPAQLLLPRRHTIRIQLRLRTRDDLRQLIQRQPRRLPGQGPLRRLQISRVRHGGRPDPASTRSPTPPTPRSPRPPTRHPRAGASPGPLARSEARRGADDPRPAPAAASRSWCPAVEASSAVAVRNPFAFARLSAPSSGRDCRAISAATCVDAASNNRRAVPRASFTAISRAPSVPSMRPAGHTSRAAVTASSRASIGEVILRSYPQPPTFLEDMFWPCSTNRTHGFVEEAQMRALPTGSRSRRRCRRWACRARRPCRR